MRPNSFEDADDLAQFRPTRKPAPRPELPDDEGLGHVGEPELAGHALDAIRLANCRRPVSVIEAFDLTPHVRRVIFRELEPSTHEPARPAEWIKLHVPSSGSAKKHGRAYTVRQRADGTLTIDMALHDGLCANWARKARAGDRAEISGPRKGYKLTWPPGDVLLGADETGLPAVASILASLPSQTRGAAWLEVPDEGDIQTLDAPPAVSVRFLIRRMAAPGSLLSEAMRAAPLSQTTTVWVAAERAAALELRDHFHAALPQDRVHTSGYWRMPSEAPDQIHLATNARSE